MFRGDSWAPLNQGVLHIKPLNAELNPICHFILLLGAHHILHVSRIRVKMPDSPCGYTENCRLLWCEVVGYWRYASTLSYRLKLYWSCGLLRNFVTYLPDCTMAHPEDFVLTDRGTIWFVRLVSSQPSEINLDRCGRFFRNGVTYIPEYIAQWPKGPSKPQISIRIYPFLQQKKNIY